MPLLPKGGGGTYEPPGPPILGTGNLVKSILNIPSGLGKLIGSLAPGGTPAGEPWSQLGWGAAKSLLTTASIPFEVASLGKFDYGERPGGLIQLAGVESPMDAIKARGILPFLVETVGNVAIGAGAATKVLKAGGLAAETSKLVQAGEFLTHPYRGTANIVGNKLVEKAPLLATEPATLTLADTLMSQGGQMVLNRRAKQQYLSQQRQAGALTRADDKLFSVHGRPAYTLMEDQFKDVLNRQQMQDIIVQNTRAKTSGIDFAFGDVQDQLLKLDPAQRAKVTKQLSTLRDRLGEERTLLGLDKPVREQVESFMQSDAFQETQSSLIEAKKTQVARNLERLKQSRLGKTGLGTVGEGGRRVDDVLNAQEALKRYEAALVIEDKGLDAFVVELNRQADLTTELADEHLSNVTALEQARDMALARSTPVSASELRKLNREIKNQTNLAAAARGRAEALRLQAQVDPASFDKIMAAQDIRRQAEDIVYNSMGQGPVQEAAAAAKAAKKGQKYVPPAKRTVVHPSEMKSPLFQEVSRSLYEFRDSLKKVIKDPDEIDQILGEMQLTFPQVVERMAQEGFTPMYWANIKPEQVSRFARDYMRLGSAFGIAVRESGARKAAEGVAAPTAARNFGAMVAETGRIVQEIHTNNLIDWVDAHGSVAYDQALVDTGQFVPWNPANPEGLMGLLERIQKGDTVIDPGAPRMIHKSMATSLAEMSKDLSHSRFRHLQKITDPWRTLTLTFSPRWYLNNTIGNVILTAAEVGSPQALRGWYNAIKQYGGGTFGEGARRITKAIWDPDYSARFPGFENQPEMSALMRSGVLPELESSTTVGGSIGAGFGVGIKEMKDRLPEGASQFTKVKTQLAFAKERAQRMNEVFDEIGRFAVYGEVLRKTKDPAKALERAQKALVDYTNLSPFERSVIRSVVPFYAWQKGILKVAAGLAIDQPARVQIYTLIGRINHDLFEEEKQLLPDYYEGLFALPGGRYLQTRNMNPFGDSLGLATPEGIMDNLNPFIDLALKWGRREGTPFGPKQPGPFGYAEAQPDMMSELLRLGGQAFLGGVSTSKARSQGLVPASLQSLGLRTVGPDEIARLRALQLRQTKQVQQGLPLPPRLKQGGSRTGRTGEFPLSFPQFRQPPQFSQGSLRQQQIPFGAPNLSQFYRNR